MNLLKKHYLSILRKKKKEKSKMSETILVKQLTKKFDEKTVINNISFKIDNGEIFGLLGPSGAGKTTIIKILTGQLKQTEGTVKVFGIENNSYDKKIYAKFGMVMDNSGLYERLTCYDNLLLFAKIYNIDKKQIRKVLEKVELEEFRNTTVRKLSKGMKQRLVLARAILHHPNVLFLDEPTSGLDPATAIKIHALLFELKETGTTIFLTTHNMEEATQMCDNVALLNLGNIVEYGSPKQICRKHNKDNMIQIICKDKQEITIKNNPQNADKIKELFKNDNVLTIHSSEPTLETVFLKLTGRELI